MTTDSQEAVEGQSVGEPLEFTFDTRGGKMMARLAVIKPGSSDRSVEHAHSLLDVLHSKIPFPYNATDEPKLCVRNVPQKGLEVSVEITISFDLPNDVARSKFKEAGFRVKRKDWRLTI